LEKFLLKISARNEELLEVRGGTRGSGGGGGEEKWNGRRKPKGDNAKNSD